MAVTHCGSVGCERANDSRGDPHPQSAGESQAAFRLEPMLDRGSIGRPDQMMGFPPVTAMVAPDT